MKFIIKKYLISLLIAFVLFIPVVSFAQNTGTGSAPTDVGKGTGTGSAPTDLNSSATTSASTKIKNPIAPIDSVDSFIKIILIGIIKIALPVVALAIIYSGFLFVTARGNSESLKKAKDALLYSVIGAAVLLGAWAIAQLISDTVLKLG